jgi:hypothetical protein
LHNRFAIAPQKLQPLAATKLPDNFAAKKWEASSFPFSKNLEREKSLELSTSTLARLRSTN